MSTTHRPHPDPDAPMGDPDEAILYDDCERCDEHAARPGDGLDAGNLVALYTLARPRTANERKASLKIGLAVRMTRIIDREIDRRTDERKDR